MGPSSNLDSAFAQQGLSDNDILLRKEFAKLFCDTHNAITACKELGLALPYVEDWARTFMGCAVTRSFIKEEQAYRATEEGLKDAHAEVYTQLRALGNYIGPGTSHSARVTAWVQYGKFLGMDQPTKTEAEVVHKGGVMLVPALTNPDEWSQLAALSQTALKETVQE